MVELSPRRSREDYSIIFTEPEEDNCFSIIAQVINRAVTFSFILLVFSSKTSRNRAVLQYYNHLARGDYSKI